MNQPTLSEIKKVLVLTKDGKQVEIERGVLNYFDGSNFNWVATWKISEEKDFRLLCDLILGTAIQFLKQNRTQVAPFMQILIREGLWR